MINGCSYIKILSKAITICHGLTIKSNLGFSILPKDAAHCQTFHQQISWPTSNAVKYPRTQRQKKKGKKSLAILAKNRHANRHPAGAAAAAASRDDRAVLREQWVKCGEKSVPESSAQSKIKRTVKSPSEAPLREVKCAMWKILCVYLDISCCVRGLCSDPSSPPLREQGMDHSFFKVSLSSLPHHTILWGEGEKEQHKQTLLAFYTSVFSLVPSPPSYSPFPLHASGPLLVLFDLKTFCILPQFSVPPPPQPPHTHRHTLSI